MRRITFSALIFILATASTISQISPNIRFEHIIDEQGLSQNAVTNIFQDHQGFIWFSTYDGLNRYDGHSFTTYFNQADDTTTISDNMVSSVYEDSRNRLWACTYGEGLNLFDRDNDSWSHFKHDANNSNSIISNDISGILEQGETGNLWVATMGGMCYYYSAENRFVDFKNTSSGYTKLFPQSAQVLSKERIHTFLCQKEKLWIGYNNGIRFFDLLNGEYKDLPILKNGVATKATGRITAIYSDSNGDIWLGTELYGFFRLDKQDYVFKPYPILSREAVVRTIKEDNDRNLWIGFDGHGLGVIEFKTKKFIQFRKNESVLNSLSNNTVYSIYQSKEGILWFGTYGGGVNVYNKYKNAFELITHIPNEPNSLSNSNARTLYQSGDGYIWIGTRLGLDCFNPVSKYFTHYKNDPSNRNSLQGDIILSILEDNNRDLLVGAFNGGLNILNRTTGDIKHYTHSEDDSTTISSNHVYKLYIDKNGRYWIGTLTGLNEYHPTTGIFTHYPFEGVTDIFEDSQSNLWIACSEGLYLFDPSGIRKKIWPIDTNEKVYVVFEDSHKRLWFGSWKNGLHQFNKQQGSIKQYTTANGLPHNRVVGILEDDDQNIWVSTGKGLSRFNPEGGLFTNYDASSGLQGNEFYNNSFIKANNGKLYAGGLKGVSMFFPSDIQRNTTIPKVYITDFKIFNKSVKRSDDKSPLNKHISASDEVNLKYSERFFTIDFIALNYIAPLQSKYEYQMVGFDSDGTQWHDGSIAKSATYTNIPPGKYTFRVRAANNDNVWNQTGTSLMITINAPFWRTWYAFLFYIVCLAALLFYFQRYTIIRTQVKNKLQIEHIEREKDQELHQTKLMFFTNISHEFRTPLTLITGPLEYLKSQLINNKDAQQSLLIIQRNATNLNNLVNQLMDFRKLEQGKMKVRMAKDNIIQFIREVYQNFESLATSKQMKFNLFAEVEELCVFFDPNILDKILNNLLSNAFKYTPSLGEVSVLVTVTEKEITSKSLLGSKKQLMPYLRIVVKDSGQGITKDAQKQIFDQFYRVIGGATKTDSGTGIGLAFTKNLIELLNGNISVESEPGKGSRFYVFIPLLYSPLMNSKNIEFLPENNTVSPLHPSISPIDLVPLVCIEEQIDDEDNSLIALIVDDNEDMRIFLKQCLSKQFKVLVASNGKEAFAKAKTTIPDIVISDVAMPEMDGIELTNKLKKEPLTAHIPIILLTAKTTHDYRLEGYKVGADAYVTKPFEPELLEARIYNLLEARQKLREKYSREVTFEPTQTFLSSNDEQFINKMMQMIEDNLSESEFGVSQLVKELATSRPVLYRKVKALTGYTLIEFIMQYKMKKAAMLLKQDKRNISEIAYMLGFSDPKYFSKCFKKFHNILPKDYISKQKDS